MMNVTGIRALLEAAEYLKKEEIAKSRELSIANQNDLTEANGTVIHKSYENETGNQIPNSDLSSNCEERTAPYQDREAHNKLEKDRRADLKARFERLQSIVPATKGKKCSNLSILRNASRYILSQTRLEREYVTRIQQLSHEKGQLDKNVERAWQRLSVLGVDLARVRRKVRSKLAQREKREESSSRDQDNLDEADRKDCDKIEKSLNGRGSMKIGNYESADDIENRSRSISPSGSHLLAGSAEMSSLSDDEEGSESTTTASECGSNGIECGEMTDEASECGEVVVQGIVPSQAHTCVTMCPTPLSPQLQDNATGETAAVSSASFQLRYANSCSMSGSFTSTTSGLSVNGGEPQSGTSSDSGFSSGQNEESNGEDKLPMKKRKLARSLVQDLSSSSSAQDTGLVIKDKNGSSLEIREMAQPPEKKLALSSPSNPRLFKTVSSTEKARNDSSDKHISLITTLPSISCPSLLAPSTATTTTTTSSGGGGVTMSPSTSLSSSMPLLQRTLTDPRTPPANLVRHHSFESPENLNPNWMNQRIVPVYQLLSGANTASPPSAPGSLPGSPPAQPATSVITSVLNQAVQSCVKPLPLATSSSPAFATTTLSGLPNVGASFASTLAAPAEKVSLVTHSPVNSMLKTATLNPPVPAAGAVVAAHSLNPAPQIALAPTSPITSTAANNSGVGATAGNTTHLVLPVIGPSDGLILRNLTSAGRHQPIVLMPITASGASQNSMATPATSLVPIQLVSDGVLSTATVVNGKLDHASRV